ncbi:MAG: glycosyltransferase, partial [Candidatus Nanopelagicales bacterium]
MAGWRTKLAGLLHEQLAPLYTAQEDQAQTLDRVRRSHEEVLGSQQEVLHSLRQTQEVVEQLTQESARVSGELLSLVHEIYGPAGPAHGHSLVTALADGQEVLLNSLAELAPPPVGPQLPAEPAAITVIIPTCDRPGGLDEALLSLRAQTRLPRRVAVVNDGSAP